VYCCHVNRYSCRLTVKWRVSQEQLTLPVFSLIIIPRPPYWPETQSKSNMGRGMITRPIWKCPCIKLFITYFRHLEKYGISDDNQANMEMPMYYSIITWCFSYWPSYRAEACCIGLRRRRAPRQALVFLEGINKPGKYMCLERVSTSRGRTCVYRGYLQAGKVHVFIEGIYKHVLSRLVDTLYKHMYFPGW
jgi:hypothetical protein